jgi:hypothetical protein
LIAETHDHTPASLSISFFSSSALRAATDGHIAAIAMIDASLSVRR